MPFALCSFFLILFIFRFPSGKLLLSLFGKEKFANIRQHCMSNGFKNIIRDFGRSEFVTENPVFYSDINATKQVSVLKAINIFPIWKYMFS